MVDATNTAYEQPKDRDPVVRLLLGVVIGLILVALVGTVSMVVFLRQHGSQPRSTAEVAVARAEAGVNAQPGDSVAWTTLAYAYANAGRFADAQNALDQGASLGASPAIDLAQADIYRIEGSNARALAVYNEAITAGIAAQKKTAAELAQKDIRVAEPETYLDRAYYGRALVRKQQGDLKGAISDIQAALKLAPQAADLRIVLGDYLADAGKPAEAAQAYREALRYLPDSLAAKRGLAEVEGAK